MSIGHFFSQPLPPPAPTEVEPAEVESTDIPVSVEPDGEESPSMRLVRLEMEREGFLLHMRELHRRNVLLQAKLDEVVGQLSAVEFKAMDEKARHAPKQRRANDSHGARQARYLDALRAIPLPATSAEVAKQMGISAPGAYLWLSGTGLRNGVALGAPRMRGNTPVRTFILSPSVVTEEAS